MVVARSHSHSHSRFFGSSRSRLKSWARRVTRYRTVLLCNFSHMAKATVHLWVPSSATSWWKSTRLRLAPSEQISTAGGPGRGAQRTVGTLLPPRSPYSVANCGFDSPVVGLESLGSSAIR
jgi:hypothetical protein